MQSLILKAVKSDCWSLGDDYLQKIQAKRKLSKVSLCVCVLGYACHCRTIKHILNSNLSFLYILNFEKICCMLKILNKFITMLLNILNLCWTLNLMCKSLHVMKLFRFCLLDWIMLVSWWLTELTPNPVTQYLDWVNNRSESNNIR